MVLEPIPGREYMIMSTEDVFELFTDFENSSAYGRTPSTTRETEGSIGVGTVFAEESRIMGRTIRTKTEVTGFDPPSGFAYSGVFDNGMTERARFELETVGSGTQMHGFAEMEIPKAPQFMSTFFAWQMKRQVRPLLDRMKEAIEATQPS